MFLSEFFNKNNPTDIAEAAESEVDATLAKIAASGNDGYEMIYDGLNGLLGGETQIILQDMYDDVSREGRLHPDDNYDQIIDHMMDRIESDWGQQGVAEGEKSPMAKDAQRADRIRSLKNLIAIAREQGRQLRVQELELELKKLQGVTEGSGNIGSAIKSLYRKIYRAGDDEIEYFYNASPIFAQYWDEYEGDLDSIIAEVDPEELAVIKAELESYAQDANLAEAPGAEKMTLHPDTYELIDEYIAKIEPDADREEIAKSIMSGHIHTSELEYALQDEDLNEFAPPGSGDDDGGFDENTLKRLAAQWWHGDEDPRVEKTLAAAGWEIGQDEGYDNGGVFVVRAGDENGNTYTSWPAEELEGLAEGSLNEFAVDGFGDSGDHRSKLLASVGRLFDAGNKVDWQVPGQMGHVTRVQDDGITMKKWKTPHSRMSFFLPMRDDSRDSKYTIKMVGPKHYAVVGAEQDVAEDKEDKIAQLKQDYATAVHWSKNDTNPHKREAARQKAEKIKRHLETQYKQGVTENSQVNEISDRALQNYRRQAHYAIQGHKFGSMKDAPNAAAIIAKREKGMDRASDKIVARKKAEDDKRLAVLVAKLPELKAEYEQMKAKYKSLGGSNWQYADREQNLSASEREARSMEGPMNNLWRQIQDAEKAQGTVKEDTNNSPLELSSMIFSTIEKTYPKLIAKFGQATVSDAIMSSVEEAGPVSSMDEVYSILQDVIHKLSKKNAANTTGLVKEAKVYYNVIGTPAESLRKDFLLTQDNQGWYLHESASKHFHQVAEKAFGKPRKM